MIEGTIHRFGHDLNTDLIHPPQFFSLDQDRVREGLMHGVDPDFLKRYRPGDLLVAGDNFACGSSRETSVYSMLHNQVGAIVAISFARIFFRNAVNNGLPIFELVDAGDYEQLRDGSHARLDPHSAMLACDGREMALRGVPSALKRWLELEVKAEPDRSVQLGRAKRTRSTARAERSEA